MNDAVLYLLVLALLARVTLDVFSLTRSNYLIDLTYCALYLSVGIFVVVDDARDILGYLSIALALFWGIKGWHAITNKPNAVSKAESEAQD